MGHSVRSQLAHIAIEFEIRRAHTQEKNTCSRLNYVLYISVMTARCVRPPVASSPDLEILIFLLYTAAVNITAPSFPNSANGSSPLPHSQEGRFSLRSRGSSVKARTGRRDHIMDVYCLLLSITKSTHGCRGTRRFDRIGVVIEPD